MGVPGGRELGWARRSELFAQVRGGAEAWRAIGNARREPAVEVEFFIVFPRRRESRVACVTLLTLGSRFRGSTGLSGTDTAPRLREILLPEHAAPVEQRDGDAAVARIGGVVGETRFVPGDAFAQLAALLGDPARSPPAAHRLRAR